VILLVLAFEKGCHCLFHALFLSPLLYPSWHVSITCIPTSLVHKIKKDVYRWIIKKKPRVKQKSENDTNSTIYSNKL
jgi:hypothetical protein